MVRVCKASKDPVARRALKAASSQQFLSVGIFPLQIESCNGFIGLHVPRMTLGLPHLRSTALHSQHFLLPSDSLQKNSSPAMSFGPPTSPLHFFKTLWFLEIRSGAQQGRRSSRPILIPRLGVDSSSWSHSFKAALGKQRYCGEAKAARSLIVSGKSDGTPYEGSRCLQPYSNPTDHSKCPYTQTPVREPRLHASRHLASSLLFGHHGPCPCQLRGRESARSWLPSLTDSITCCSVSAEKASAITFILDSSPRPPMGSLPQPARPLCPAIPAHWAQSPLPASSAPGILKCSLLALGDFMGSVWVGSLCLHLLPGLAKNDASKSLPDPKIPALPPGLARKCLAH